MISPFKDIKREEVPDKILLIPFFPEKKYFSKIRDHAIKMKKVLFSEFIFFDDMMVITGFFGYPSVLTVLEFVGDLKEKDLLFIGTAGSINRELDGPAVLNVKEIFPDEAIKSLSDKKSFKMKRDYRTLYRNSSGVTVDIIQRETPDWVSEQKKKGMDFVEMEIFPIAALMDRGFEARVILTDAVTERGIQSFGDKKRVKELFIEQFEIFGGI